jgi:hypothetical protein
MGKKPCGEGREQEGREQQSATHQNLLPSKSILNDGRHYSTEFMSVAWQNFPREAPARDSTGGLKPHYS